MILASLSALEIVAARSLPQDYVIKHQPQVDRRIA
jgi:hypothetical protein